MVKFGQTNSLFLLVSVIVSANSPCFRFIPFDSVTLQDSRSKFQFRSLSVCLSELLVIGGVQENKALSPWYTRGILMEKDLTSRL